MLCSLTIRKRSDVRCACVIIIDVHKRSCLIFLVARDSRHHVHSRPPRNAGKIVTLERIAVDEYAEDLIAYVGRYHPESVAVRINGEILRIRSQIRTARIRRRRCHSEERTGIAYGPPSSRLFGIASQLWYPYLQFSGSRRIYVILNRSQERARIYPCAFSSLMGSPFLCLAAAEIV
jgi:hypothetical protein